VLPSREIPSAIDFVSFKSGFVARRSFPDLPREIKVDVSSAIDLLAANESRVRSIPGIAVLANYKVAVFAKHPVYNFSPRERRAVSGAQRSARGRGGGREGIGGHLRRIEDFYTPVR